MDDSEARYVIEQFNKYASWVAKAIEPGLSFMALLIASSALVIVGWSIAVPVESISFLLRQVLFWITIGIFIVTVPVLTIPVHRAIDKCRDNEERLRMLEDYRFKYKSLPDTLTLETIVTNTPEELRELLEADQPSREQSS